MRVFETADKSKAKTGGDQAKEITELKAALKQQSELMQDFAARLQANGL